MMTFRIIGITVIICFLTSFTGCWDQVELEKRAVIVAIGIDKAEQAGEITLTLQSVIPNRLIPPIYGGGNPQQRAVRVVSTSGKTILEALKNYKQQTNNPPFLQENQLLIIGEDLARDGVGPFIDFFIRSPESRTRAWVLVSKGKASDVINWQSEARRIPADYIDEMIHSRNSVATFEVEDIHHFILKLANQSSSPSTAGIELVPKEANQSPEVRLFGTAVFKKDKLAGWLNYRETSGLLWIINEFRYGILETSFPGKPAQKVALQIIRARAEVDPELNNGRIYIKLKITADGTLGEQSGKIKLTDKATMRSLEKKAATEIRKEVQAALNKSQKEFNSDVFGFGEEIDRKFPQRWKTLRQGWEEEFPMLQVFVFTKVKIKGINLIMDPINLK
ncbi:MAG TPA: Ger(x)C family spore germination protein [Bacillota bacterium]|nr:Ger(x)C family spore germination protein [Bacillota bacterium]